MGGAVAITRVDMTAAKLSVGGGRRMVRQRGGCWLLRWCLMGGSQVSGRDMRDGSPDVAGLGASLQR
jgi:hypothetical protein